ncbi:hypothetical protein [Pantoea stewartii]|uniref:hypothetical protein n=1 Tax=Pantoea stewartii TaxID=66269 RepID=UPI000AB9E4FA|nr:hypothetical protein [Pantoea stewartii]
MVGFIINFKVGFFGNSIIDGILMRFLPWLVGRDITELLQHGFEIDEVIALQENSILACSTTELELYFKQPAESLPWQNAFPIAIVLELELVAFAFNLLIFLRALLCSIHKYMR